MTRTSHPELLQQGDSIWHYQVVRRLGAGGFAIAFLVEHAGRLFTLKMAARPPEEDDELREDERACREPVALGHFRHPNLLIVHETGRWPDVERGHFYFVTDYIPGSTFNVWRWKTHAPLRKLVGMAGELCLVLAELHERGVCHRDIKPDNVLVRDGDEKPFLIDFGAVYLPGAYTLTRALPPVTFHNMAPEVAAFLRAGDWEEGARHPAHPAADLYAFGALLYEALTDCHPFNPRLPADKLLLAIELLPPVEPVRLEARVPPGLNELVMRLLAKEPEQRPPSARGVHEELMRMLEAEGGTEAWTVPYAFPTAHEGTDSPEEAEPEEPEVAREAPEPPPRPEETAGPSGSGRSAWGPREGWKRAFAVLALMLVLLGVGWRLTRAVCVSALEAACPGAASTALAMPAPSEKGRTPLIFSTPRFPGGLHALFCAAVSQLLGCASAPVRPDVGGFLEQCPPEARMTAARLGFDKTKTPIVAVRLMTGAEVGAERSEGMINLKSGSVGGWMFLPESQFDWETNKAEHVHWVSGEAKGFPDRVYIQFDRIFLDAVYPTQGRVPSPICGVAVSDLDRTQFGVRTFAASPDPGVKIDPAKVVYQGPDAAILNIPRVDTYVQLPEHHFPK